MKRERRKSARVPALVETHWEGPSGYHVARISDISLGGCFLDTTGEARVGDKIKLKILLPTEQWLVLSGTVAYDHSPLGYGVVFSSMSDRHRSALSLLIDVITGSMQNESAGQRERFAFAR